MVAVSVPSSDALRSALPMAPQPTMPIANPDIKPSVNARSRSQQYHAGPGSVFRYCKRTLGTQAFRMRERAIVLPFGKIESEQQLRHPAKDRAHHADLHDLPR